MGRKWQAVFTTITPLRCTKLRSERARGLQRMGGEGKGAGEEMMSLDSEGEMGKERG